METKKRVEENCYQSPQVEIVEVNVEAGFAVSAPGNMWEENGF